jgi:hypothetical protein
VARHAPVTWIDHRAWYYPLPFQAILLFGLAWGLERWALGRDGGLPRVVPIAILALVVANVARWPELKQRMQSGPWFSYVSRDSAAFKRSVEAGSPDPLLDDGYRRFFFDCLERFPRLAARAGAYVREADDVEEPWFRDGRLFAWARREGHLAALAPHGGTYLMEGGLRLRPGEKISIFRGGEPRNLLARVVRSGDTEGPEPVSIVLDLPAGKTELRVVSDLPERQTSEGPARWKRAGFGVLLPFLLRPVPPPASAAMGPETR